MKTYRIISFILFFALNACVVPQISFPTYITEIKNTESGFNLKDDSYMLLDVQGNAYETLEIQSKFLKDINNISSQPVVLVSSENDLLISPELNLNPSKEEILEFAPYLEADYLINMHINVLKDDLFSDAVAEGGISERRVEIMVESYNLKTGKIHLQNSYVGKISDTKEPDEDAKKMKIKFDASKSLKKLTFKTYKKCWKHLKEYSIY